MITEDFVSYELAKLLKEKGFDELCKYVYYDNGDRYTLMSTCYQNVCDEGEYLCPTHQMAMKWLRNVHKLHIEISVDVNDKHCFYASIYYNGEECWEEKEYYPDGVTTYEEAVEAALKYSLENLI